MVFQQIAEPLARADRIARQHRLLARLAQALEVIDHRLVDVGAGRAFGAEIARPVDVEVEDGGALRFVERRGQMRARRVEARRPFLGVEIQRLGGEWPIAARLRRLGALAVLVIIGDRFHPPLGGAGDAKVAHHHVVGGEMVEQRRQLLLEQRQPMFHAGEPPPVADRLIQGIAGRGRAELVAIARAEALDRLLVEQRFRRGEQREAVDPPGGPLVLGAEGAHRLDLVAEEVEPQRLVLAARIQIDDAAAHRIFALVVDRLGADIAIRLEQPREVVAVDPCARLQRRDELADAERGEHALRRRIGGGEHQLRRLRRLLQLPQCRDPLGHDAQRRARAIIRQAVPRRKADHLQFGREERRRRRHGAHRRIVRRDEHRATLRRTREIGEQRRLEAGGDPRERQRGLGGQDRLQIGHHFLG